jgi:CheY-like chemotaxis protein
MDVLLIEDDLDLRAGLAELLGDEGYAVAAVPNGLEALRCMRAGGVPRLVLMDLSTPVMNGRDFRAEQLRDPRLALVPVVLLSGDGALDEQAASLGAAAFVTKPFSLQHLLATVARVFLAVERGAAVAEAAPSAP